MNEIIIINENTISSTPTPGSIYQHINSGEYLMLIKESLLTTGNPRFAFLELSTGILLSYTSTNLSDLISTNGARLVQEKSKILIL